MNEQGRIARLVFQEMENEKITEKLKHVETIELIHLWTFKTPIILQMDKNLN